jgi:hypothetical protein
MMMMVVMALSLVGWKVLATLSVSDALQPMQVGMVAGATGLLPRPLCRGALCAASGLPCFLRTGLNTSQGYTGGDGGPGVFLDISGTSVCYAGEVVLANA